MIEYIQDKGSLYVVQYNNTAPPENCPAWKCSIWYGHCFLQYDIFSIKDVD